MPKSAIQMTEGYRRGVSSAGPAYQAGVESVTVNPAQLAINAQDKWAQGVQAAVANGSFAKGLQNVTLSGWKTKTKNAVSKYTNAAPQAADEFGKYASKAAPIIAEISATIQAMPNVTEADAERRMLENMKLMRSRLKGINSGG